VEVVHARHLPPADGGDHEGQRMAPAERGTTRLLASAATGSDHPKARTKTWREVFRYACGRTVTTPAVHRTESWCGTQKGFFFPLVIFLN
jgi:hypothetical protein